MSKINRCVVRNQAYRAGEFGLRERHNERKNECYGNGDMADMYELAKKAAGSVLKNKKNWAEFLKTTANNHKYSFWEQLLIHEQQPNAVACADEETWKKLGRRVKDSTKMIMLVKDFDEDVVRMVADVSQTVPINAEKSISLWEMKEQYETEVCSHLAEQYSPGEGTSLTDVFRNIAKNELETVIPTLKILKIDIPEMLPFLEDSIVYMLRHRCGMKDNPLPNTFDRVKNIEGVWEFSYLGTLCSNTVQGVLNEVAKVVRQEEKHFNALLDENRTRVYNESIKKQEGENSNGEIDLSKRGKISDTEHRNAGAGEEPHRKIWKTASKVFKGVFSGRVFRPNDNRNVGEGISGNRQDSGRTIGNVDNSNGKSRGSDRAAESYRPNEMGGLDEQHKAGGRGSRTERDNLQLSEDEKAGGVKLPAFFDEKNIVSKEDIDSVLQSGSGVVDGKYRIYSQFRKGEDKKKNIDFLKSEYERKRQLCKISGT